MNRRAFLSLAPAAALAQPAPNKRQRMLDWLAGKTDPHYTPAAFFLHFDPQFKNGPAAATRHLDFFRQTDMDFVKVQFEQAYDLQPSLKSPADWAKLTLRKIDFYEPLLVTVRQLVAAAKKDALVLMTLYSPFMSAGQCAPAPLLHRHLTENPDAVKRGLEILTESQLIFVRACINAGIDGFYMSTQGSEANRFSNPKIFANYIKPHDLPAMREASNRCPFNILHVCDYHQPYSNFDAVLDYPGHVVNANTRLTTKSLTPAQISALFKRPYMGGLDRHGLLAKGPLPQLDAEIKATIAAAPRQFILAADCTVASDTPWPRLRHAIDAAHGRI